MRDGGCRLAHRLEMAFNLIYVLHAPTELLKEHGMSVNPTMPTTGTSWTDDPAALIASGENKGYRQDSCVWNVAWNELHAQGKGAENSASRVAAVAQALIKQYNDGVAKGTIHDGQNISNPNDVTTGQLTVMAHEAEPDKTPVPVSAPASSSAAPYHPFVGPLPEGEVRPVVDSRGQIVPGSDAGVLPPGSNEEWPFIGPLAVGVPRPLVDSNGTIVPGSLAGVQPPA
jgi:hypothetical protein